MIKINKERTVQRTITVHIMNEDGKNYTKGDFVVLLKQLSQSRHNEIADLMKEGEINDTNVADEVLVKVLSGITDDKGNDVDPEEARQFVVDDPYCCPEIVYQYFDCFKGSRFRSKRSSGSR